MRHSTIISLVLSLLTTAVQGSNPLFGAYTTGECDSCLDQVYESCPGDYRTRSYATCMCAGDGSAGFVSCLSSCDASLNEPANAASTYYGYCVMFFKQLCDGAEEYLDADKYNEECSKKAIAAGGLGEKDGDEKGGDDDTEEPEKPEANETKGSSSKETGDAASSDEANESETTKTGDSAKSTSTSGAMATVVPAWAIIAGMGLQLMGV